MDQKRKLNFVQDHEDDLIILAENENASESKIANYKSYTDRYFKKYYKLDVRYENNDNLLLIHSNKIVVCTLAPSHPILNKLKYKIDKVQFMQQVNEEMSGKHKHNAKILTNQMGLCRLYYTSLDKTDTIDEKDRYFVVYSCLNGKLIETNQKLIQNPELLQNKASTEGYLAIMMTKLDSWKAQIDELTTHEQYLEIKNKNEF